MQNGEGEFVAPEPVHHIEEEAVADNGADERGNGKEVTVVHGVDQGFYGCGTEHYISPFFQSHI